MFVCEQWTLCLGMNEIQITLWTVGLSLTFQQENYQPNWHHQTGRLYITFSDILHSYDCWGTFYSIKIPISIKQRHFHFVYLVFLEYMTNISCVPRPLSSLEFMSLLYILSPPRMYKWIVLSPLNILPPLNSVVSLYMYIIPNPYPLHILVSPSPPQMYNQTNTVAFQSVWQNIVVSLIIFPKPPIPLGVVVSL